MTALLDEHGTPKLKVLIAVPCGDQVAAGFAQDLALLIGFTTFAKPDMELAPPRTTSRSSRRTIRRGRPRSSRPHWMEKHESRSSSTTGWSRRRVAEWA